MSVMVLIAQKVGLSAQEGGLNRKMESVARHAPVFKLCAPSKSALMGQIHQSLMVSAVAMLACVVQLSNRFCVDSVMRAQKE